MRQEERFRDRSEVAREREWRRRWEREREAVRCAIRHSLGREINPFPAREWDDERETWRAPGPPNLHGAERSARRS